MAPGRLLLRLTIAGTFFVHGTQKLFGWFGGYGLAKQGLNVEQILKTYYTGMELTRFYN